MYFQWNFHATYIVKYVENSIESYMSYLYVVHKVKKNTYLNTYNFSKSHYKIWHP